PGVKVATVETVTVPVSGETRRAMLTQHLIPVLDTEWLAVVTTSTAEPAMAAAVEDVADEMAASLTLRR
ncbi:MAG TPA: hypothetical protein VF045_02155, partial [Acidimicrobiales bacterium]